MTRLVIGDSHSGHVARAAVHLGRDDLRGRPLASALRLHEPFFQVVDGDVEFFDRVHDHWVVLRRISGVHSLLDLEPRSVITSIGLAAPPFYWNKMWRGSFSFSPEPRADIHLVTRGQIRQIIEDMQAPAIAFHEWLIENDLLYAAVAGPPPQRGHRMVVDYLGPEKTLELDRMYQVPMRALLAARGIPVVEAQGVTDDDGFLLSEFDGTDQAHGSQDFYCRLIDAIDELER